MCLEDYDKCTGCVNLVSGTLYGDKYKTCKGGVINPILCPRTNSSWVKDDKAEVEIKVEKPKRRKRKMKKQLYKEELRKIVSKRLRELRTTKGISQAKLVADLKFKIKHAAYSLYERGVILPVPEKIAILAKYFGVTIEYMYGAEDRRPEGFFSKLLKFFKGGK